MVFMNAQVPLGTHEWNKFINPEELNGMLRDNGVVVENTEGMIYDPLSGAWTLAPLTMVNYVTYGIKDGPPRT